MKGLLLKDFFVYKKTLWFILAIAVLYGIIGGFTGNMGMLYGIVMLFTSILSSGAQSYDEKCDWEKYALTMPISRKTLIKQRHVMGMGSIFSVTAILLVIGIILEDHAISITLALLSFMAFLGTLNQAIALVSNSKYGAEKGKIVRLLVIVVISMIMVGVPTFMGLDIAVEWSGIGEHSKWGIPVAFLFMGLSLVICYVSYNMCVKIYEKKEF